MQIKNLYKIQPKKIVFIYVFHFFIFIKLNSSAQIVLTGTSIININGGIAGSPSYLVLNSPPTIPIATIGSSSGIMMEDEYNITKYNVGVLTNTISVPYFSYNSGTGVQFPLLIAGLSGSSVSTATAALQFSSKRSSTFSNGWNNSLYVPSDVTNGMGGYIYPSLTYTANNSAKVIDRFWVIDALGYSVSPSAIISFGYINAESNANGGNSISSTSNLQAMAYDLGATSWGNYTPSGINTVGATISTVSAVYLSKGLIGKVFRSWTLVDNLSILPVTLLNFDGICNNGNMIINWSTASESNSNYFTLEKSYDGLSFSWLANVKAVGNSRQTNNYSYEDKNELGDTYYRLSEIDLNGSNEPFKIIFVKQCALKNENDTISLTTRNGGINLAVFSLNNQDIEIKLFEITGSKTYNQFVSVTKGNNRFWIDPNVTSGIYLINIETASNKFTKKLIIIK